MDIVERLTAYRPMNCDGDGREHHAICDEAAAEITALRERVAELEGALEPFGMAADTLTEVQARIRRNAKRWLADPEVRAKMAEQERAALRAKGGE